MSEQLHRIREYLRDFSDRLRIIRQGGRENVERMKDYRRELDRNLEQNPPYCPLQYKKEIDIKI